RYWYQLQHGSLTGLLAMLLLPLHRSKCSCSNISHFITKEIIWPVFNLAKHIQSQRLQFGRRTCPTAKVHGNIFCAQLTLSNAALDTVEEMLRVTFHNQLHMTLLAVLSSLGGGNKHIGQLCLHLRMKMDFRLFHPDCGVGRTIKRLG